MACIGSKVSEYRSFEVVIGPRDPVGVGLMNSICAPSLYKGEDFREVHSIRFFDARASQLRIKVRIFGGMRRALAWRETETCCLSI